MKANKRLLKKVNTITSKYSRWAFPSEIRNMYDELNAIGVSVGLISNGNDRCEWYYNGEEVENSLFIYQTYETLTSFKTEYNIYFS